MIILKMVKYFCCYEKHMHFLKNKYNLCGWVKIGNLFLVKSKGTIATFGRVWGGGKANQRVGVVDNA